MGKRIEAMKLRKATIDDLELIHYWDTKEHVINCDPDDFDWDWENELLHDPIWRDQLIAELDSRPIGFIQIIDPFPEETHYWGEDVDPNKRAIDIWIGEESDLNIGFGTQMMNLAIERCFAAENVTGILIDPLKSNVKAIRFYERLGFEFVEERNFFDSECAVYELKRSAWESH